MKKLQNGHHELFQFYFQLVWAIKKNTHTIFTMYLKVHQKYISIFVIYLNFSDKINKILCLYRQYVNDSNIDRVCHFDAL